MKKSYKKPSLKCMAKGLKYDTESAVNTVQAQVCTSMPGCPGQCNQCGAYK